MIKPDKHELEEFLLWRDDINRFVWKQNLGRGCKGEIAGSFQPNGYRAIMFRRNYLLEHHVVWMFAYGEWPRQLDHIDGNRVNNAIANLREATNSQNIANSKLSSANKTGFKGVVARPGGYVAYITKDRRQLYLGKFSTAEEAHAAYMEAARKLQGEFARAS